MAAADRPGIKRLQRPNFFIVGAQNSATTALYLYLREHPGVFMPAMKEPHYFSNLIPVRRMRYPVSHVSDRRSYLRLFSPAGERIAVGEASSSYLWELNSATRIQEMIPHAKIIIMLRDPVARAYSHYLMDLREGWANLPFYDALQRDWDSSVKGYGISRLYVELGLYCNQVNAYLKTFGSRAVRVIFFDEFIGSVNRGDSQMLDSICGFLGLDCDGLRLRAGQPVPRVRNGYAEARFEWSRQLAGSRIARRLGQAILPQRAGSTFILKRRLYEPIFLIDAEKPSIDPGAKRWLCDIFDNDIASLERLLGRELPDLRKTW